MSFHKGLFLRRNLPVSWGFSAGKLVELILNSFFLGAIPSSKFFRYERRKTKYVFWASRQRISCCLARGCGSVCRELVGQEVLGPMRGPHSLCPKREKAASTRLACTLPAAHTVCIQLLGSLAFDDRNV